MIGQNIAHYKVTAKLGAGGMGEVYRATDTKLGRDVALKVLPAAFAADAQRMARFRREAQVLASLNHPHIAAIYGLEHREQTQALAMELVEGATLGERINAARGGIPLEEALPLARQIAEALEYAHERGIVHRDLKPANIKLTPDGLVKVLDFGLAKAMAEDSAAPDISTSPTLSIAATKAGMILGTAAYMSPEQARGRAVDRRTDVWAFGCVLYEMLTGQHAFPGEDVSETLAAIIRGEPDWAALPRGVPAPVAKLLRRCLDKDAKRRLQAIGEARIAIEEYLANPAAALPSVAEAAHPSGSAARAGRAGWVVAGLIALAAVSGQLYFARTAEAPRVVRAFIPAPEKAVFDFVGNPFTGPPAISPDGRMLVFAAHLPTGPQMLWIRGIDSLAAQPLPGTENAAHPFWSPDSRTVGFFSAGKLKRIEAAGGPPITVCDAFEGRGGTWSRDGMIVFSPGPTTSLQVVSAAGGSSRQLTQLDKARGETTHRWPHFLPDGRRFLYLGRVGASGGGVAEGTAIMIGSLDGSPPRMLLRAASNVAFASGHLLFAQESSLMARPLNPERLEFSGDAFPIAEQVQYDPSFSRGVFSASENGLLVYQSAEGSPGTKLVWFDRTGKQMGQLGDPATYIDLSISPDRSKVAVAVSDPRIGPPDLWVYEIARGMRTRFTFHPAVEGHPVWAPDSSRLAFRTAPKGVPDLYQKSLGGTGQEELLLETDLAKFPTSWSSDGRFLAYDVAGAVGTGGDIWVLQMTGDRKPRPFLETPFREHQARFSPDGRWMAYASNESGRIEVYVSPFPGPGRKWQVSGSGGQQPRWRGDGRELFYMADDNKIISVEVGARGDTFEVGKSKALLQTQPSRRGTPYDVTHDGQRFLVNVLLQEQASAPMTLVVNWPATLPKK